MATRFITEISTKFNPFSPGARSARIFLSRIPPNARQGGLSVSTTLLPQSSTEPSTLRIKFKDGMELNLDCDQVGINGIMEQVERHSRKLHRQKELTEG